MKTLLENSILVSNLSKTILYSLEYKLLNQLSKAFSFFVKPPYQETDKELIKFLGDEVIKLHQEDAKNIADGIYPINVIKPKNATKHILNIPRLLIDSLKISRRRKLNIKNDLGSEAQNAPAYLKRNYHFQTDGYFSEHSASLYEHQVEILFSGTAAPMRRMLIKMIKERLSNSDQRQPLKILEIGAGVGSATLDFSKSFTFDSYTVTDISAPYLHVASKRFDNPQMHFVEAAGESLPFPDEEFDLVFSVFLFHELPRAVREKVLSESYRVLKRDGIVAICDSLQKDDVPRMNRVLENFPIDYHEPYYKSYTLWDVARSLKTAQFTNIQSSFKLLSKYWIANK